MHVLSVSSVFFLYVMFQKYIGVAHGMRVENSWQCGPAVGALGRKSDVAGALARCAGSFSCARAPYDVSVLDQTSGRY
jgi:hypothetical protein